MALSVSIDAFRLISKPLSSHAIYVSELVKSLSVLSDIQRLYLLVPRKPGHDFIYNELTDLKNVKLIWPDHDVFPERNFRSQVYWVQWVIPHLLRRSVNSIDYYVAQYHHPPLLLAKGIRVVTVIHDLCGLRADCGYVKTKKGFYRHLFMFLVASIRSDLFIPVSEYTKSQLKKTFPFLASRISNVVYNGVSCETVSDVILNQTCGKYGIYRKDYFIGFGVRGLRKGLDLILASYKLYRERGGQASLVLIVADKQRYDVQEIINVKRIKDVVMVSNISASERDALYRGALALLFPSRCEGFGYPIVEAMRQGCPPIAWQEGPSREIVGSVSPLLAKLDCQEIVDRMVTFEHQDSNTRLELAERLIRQSMLFRGDRFGRHFLEAMKGINLVGK